MSILASGGRLSAALLCLALSAPLTQAAHAQSAAASQAWSRFAAANSGNWTPEWSATGDQVESLRGLSAPASGNPLKIASDFINANADVLGLANGAADLKLVSHQEENGDTHLQYQQTYGALPVFNGFVDVHMNGGGQVYLLNNSAVSSSVAHTLSLQPNLSAMSAAQFARAEQHTFYDKRGVPFTVAVKPVGQPQLGIEKTDTGARLAYFVDLGPVAYVIDANSGLKLDTIEYMHSVTANGSGTIFDPNPVNTLNNSALRDKNDADQPALQNAYLNKTLQDLTKTGSGSNTRYSLLGPYVTTFDAPKATVQQCSGNPSMVAKPPAKSTLGTFPVNRSNVNFEHVMAYFHIDRSARYIHSIGFPNLWKTPIRVDAHGITDDNSFYCGKPVGAGFLIFGDGGVDDAEDADVILHEFGHSLQDASSNGRYLAAGQTGAMGEGFGDYWSFSQKSGGPWAPCFADWDSQGTCLRRLDKNKKFPANYVGEVHADGEIWSRGLRDLFTKIGKTKADRIILKSHYLIAANPNFTKGVDALIDADEAIFSGAHKDDICAVFLDRGISANGCGYWLQISWDKVGADVDLHLRPPSGAGNNTWNFSGDVAYYNTHPNWGDPSSTDDDPQLYSDCTTTCTSEKITVSSLAAGKYRALAHYYNDHSKGSTTVTFEILQGATRLFKGTKVLTPGASPPTTGQIWFAYNIVVSGASVQVVDAGQVVSGSTDPHGAAKK